MRDQAWGDQLCVRAVEGRGVMGFWWFGGREPPLVAGVEGGRGWWASVEAEKAGWRWYAVRPTFVGVELEIDPPVAWGKESVSTRIGYEYRGEYDGIYASCCASEAVGIGTLAPDTKKFVSAWRSSRAYKTEKPERTGAFFTCSTRLGRSFVNKFKRVYSIDNQ